MTESLPGLDTDSVCRALERNLTDVDGPFQFELIAAGGSNLTFRVTGAAGTTLALRRPPAGPRLPTAHDVEREWQIISALADSAVPVPGARWYCDDVDVTGAPFYVMDFVPGHVLRDAADAALLSTDEAARASESLIDTQIAFHTLDLEQVGLADLGRHDDYLGRQLKRWRTQVERADARPTPLLFELHDRLAASKPPERLPAGLAHGDYRFDNTILGTDHRVAAVLDWELCTTGDPIADFAWSLQYWADPDDEVTFLADPPTVHDTFPQRDEVAERYANRMSLDLKDLPYYVAFSWWKQACIVEGVYARRLLGSTGGAETGPVEGIAAKADQLAERAQELARGVV
ncbi:MAG: phosphotransferase family protein [Acidimicrobiia bacterium]|nr:phosphotransferase family protein [Acidimicrobiia bacterium]